MNLTESLQSNPSRKAARLISMKLHPKSSLFGVVILEVREGLLAGNGLSQGSNYLVTLQGQVILTSETVHLAQVAIKDLSQLPNALQAISLNNSGYKDELSKVTISWGWTSSDRLHTSIVAWDSIGKDRPPTLAWEFPAPPPVASSPPPYSIKQKAMLDDQSSKGWLKSPNFTIFGIAILWGFAVTFILSGVGYFTGGKEAINTFLIVGFIISLLGSLPFLIPVPQRYRNALGAKEANDKWSVEQYENYLQQLTEQQRAQIRQLIR